MESKKHTKIDVNVDEFTENIAVILPDLADLNNYQKKSNARRYLVDMGKVILPQLNKLLESKNSHLRREASKIIELIGDKESIPTLLSLLGDDESSIRWIASEGLVHIGRESIVPLLDTLVQRGDDTYLKLSARHVLIKLFNDEEREDFRPLLLSLKNFNNIAILAPVEAFRALLHFKHLHQEKPKTISYHWHH
jgi:HEAT repeat protein